MHCRHMLAGWVGFALSGNAALVFATNGMNLEGYGPVSMGMGGTGMAFDHGTAAVMHNPATLGLMPAGHRLDVALDRHGFLHARVGLGRETGLARLWVWHFRPGRHGH